MVIIPKRFHCLKFKPPHVVRFVVDKNLKVKSKYSLILGQNKQNLYRAAYSRIQRAIKIGAHIEAVALIESIMSDRFESALAVLSQEQVHASTLGALISKFDKISGLEPQLKSALYEWNDSRAFVIHQMVKLTNEETSTWLERIAFARRTAKEGVILLGELRKVTDKVIRTAVKDKP